SVVPRHSHEQYPRTQASGGGHCEVYEQGPPARGSFPASPAAQASGTMQRELSHTRPDGQSKLVRHSSPQTPALQISDFAQSELNEQGRPATTPPASSWTFTRVPAEVSSLLSAQVPETQSCSFTQSSKVAQPSRH